jgi:hypothetical protein
VYLHLLAGIKHDYWFIYLSSFFFFYLTGLGRCHFYIRMDIGGCKLQRFQLSSRHAVLNPTDAQLVTNANASQPVDMNGSRSTTASSPLTSRCVA